MTFIPRRADINLRDSEGWSPLHYACFKSRTQFVEILLKNRANTKSRTAKGELPIDVARGQFKEQIIKLIQDSEPIIEPPIEVESRKPTIKPDKPKIIRNKTPKEVTKATMLKPIPYKPKAYLPSPRKSAPKKVQVPTADLELEKEIGRGGCGIVYLAKYKGTQVAAKQLTVKLTPENKLFAIEQIINEAKTMMKMKHARIVTFIDYDIATSSIIMEYMPVGSLGSYIFNHQNMGWDERFSVLKDVAEGMDFLHAKFYGGTPKQDVFHQDLKSQNVLLHFEGKILRAKLTDFGLSVVREVLACDDGNSFVNLNGYTPGYRAPELKTTNKFTKLCDVYSYGIILLEMITLNEPTEELASKFYPMLMCMGLPRSLEQALDHTLCQDPSLRWDFGRLYSLLKSDERAIKSFTAGNKKFEQRL